MGGLPGCLRSIVAGWSLTGQKLPGKIFSRPNASNRLALVEFRDGAVFQTGGVSLHCVSDVAVAHANQRESFRTHDTNAVVDGNVEDERLLLDRLIVVLMRKKVVHLVSGNLPNSLLRAGEFHFEDARVSLTFLP
ncbi:hypothetical protein D3C71_1508200 [compost metagenome]